MLYVGTEPLDAIGVANSLYGLRNMYSEHVEVRQILTALTRHISACNDDFTPKQIGNALYGLRGMSSDHIEVQQLLTKKVSA